MGRTWNQHTLRMRSLAISIFLLLTLLLLPLPDSGAAYIFVADDGVWQETGVRRSTDAEEGDQFGCAAAIDADIAVVGACREDGGVDAGAAYVMARNQDGAGQWGQVTTLRASDAQADDIFGYSVGISGDTIVVGAPSAEAAYIFERNQGGPDNWGQVTILHGSDGTVDDDFGRSVAISGGIVVVGAMGEDGGLGDPIPGAGAAYIFARDQGGAGCWGEVTILRASDAEESDYFGMSIGVSGDAVVVGAPGPTCNQASPDDGAAYVFEQSEGGAGNPMSMAGAAYVFNRNQGGAGCWGEVTTLRASDAQVEDMFGTPVSIRGDIIAIGATGEDGGTGDPVSEGGGAYIFQRNLGGADTWGEVAVLRAADAQPSDWGG